MKWLNSRRSRRSRRGCSGRRSRRGCSGRRSRCGCSGRQRSGGRSSGGRGGRHLVSTLKDEHRSDQRGDAERDSDIDNGGAVHDRTVKNLR